MWHLVQPAAGLAMHQQVADLCAAHDSVLKQLPRRPPFVRRRPYISEVAAALLVSLRDARAEVRRLQEPLCRLVPLGLVPLVEAG